MFWSAGRFPMLAYTVRLKTEKVASLILCAFVFHNIAKHINDPDDFVAIPEEPQPPSHYQNEANENNLRQLGEDRRKEIAELVYERRN